MKPVNSTYFGGLKKIQIKHYFDRNGNILSHNAVRYFFLFQANSSTEQKLHLLLPLYWKTPIGW